ncbi:MAG TPA: MBL fold metallo-hydrolase [Verrucomicrobiae bacterium]|nr:MBL fold metallo-hydrolase [Verrucomicrobiae bacterium]
MVTLAAFAQLSPAASSTPWLLSPQRSDALAASALANRGILVAIRRNFRQNDFMEKIGLRGFRRRVLAFFVLITAFAFAFIGLAAAGPGIEKIPAAGGDIQLHPINHASFILEWNGKTIFVDPVGGAEKFKGTPTLILVTDIHGDHLNAGTLKAVARENTIIIAPEAVASQLPAELKSQVTVMANGERKEVQGISIEALPMYNLTPDRLKYHSKGRGNGYVLTLGGKRVYISGDTEDIPEMRALKNIDLAFVCMNLPYTMTVEQAASAVKEFKPKIVYPYHFRGSDTEKFKQLVGNASGVEVRLLKWY